MAPKNTLASGEIVIHEDWRISDESPLMRQRRHSYEMLRYFLLIGRLSLPITTVILCAFLTYDVPVFMYDGYFEVATLPSGWLRIGDVLMALALAQILILTRQYGGAITRRAVTSAWVIAIIVTTWFLFAILHKLEAADMPSLRFVLSVIGGWYVGHITGVEIYDLKRGAIWWQAPFYAGSFAFAVQSFLYFSVNFAGHGEGAWFYWFISDYAIKIGYVMVFVLAYRYIRNSVKPMSGYGG